METKSYYKIGLILSIVTLVIIIFREEIKHYILPDKEEGGNGGSGSGYGPGSESIADKTADLICENTPKEVEKEVYVLETEEERKQRLAIEEEERVYQEYQKALEQERKALEEFKELSLGSEGKEVQELQNEVNEVLRATQSSLEPLRIDGDFGAKTEQAVISTFGRDSMTLKDAETEKKVLLS